ncbi:MAG: alpha/beta fold hydrolase [Bacteroidetes bacterium]|jgi:predicted alpha/beta-fold hydrolase|nr:MAG: alpha/beta fold hydrolase [Bacteroidota bacterium]UCE69904.1 MAG: alpha/beta fold hydrolase [Flavobacteriaceae bacterium]
MPLLSSTYRPEVFFRNGHLATIYSALLRKVEAPEQIRERITLPDGDFIDLDWSRADGPTDKVLILLHGLEGNAQRPYMVGSARLFNTSGYDVCAVNLRGCSGEPNLLFRSYHSGATEDLEAVIQHIEKAHAYSRIYLKGFSLGGNLILKFLGERPHYSNRIAGAAAISVPCDLYDSLLELNKPKNWLYARRFLTTLREKVLEKQKRFPGRITLEEAGKIRSLRDFDDYYTSRAHGFADAIDYYTRCSSLQFLEGIRVPTLLLNARNDSFLGPHCYPGEVCKNHPRLFFESPDYGGHVGFVGEGTYYYSEQRSLEFLRECE